MNYPKHLDKFSASPVGDKAEFRAAFDAIQSKHPDKEIEYIGTDGALHYFQERGNATPFTVAVSDGWKAA